METAFGAPAGALDEPEAAERPEYRPGDFLRQTGLTIAICLGFAVLAQMLVSMVGEY